MAEAEKQPPMELGIVEAIAPAILNLADRRRFMSELLIPGAKQFTIRFLPDDGRSEPDA